MSEYTDRACACGHAFAQHAFNKIKVDGEPEGAFTPSYSVDGCKECDCERFYDPGKRVTVGQFIEMLKQYDSDTVIAVGMPREDLGDPNFFQYMVAEHKCPDKPFKALVIASSCHYGMKGPVT